MLLNQYQFTFLAGADTQVFLIEELVWGLVGWPHRCRLRLPATCEWEAQTFYGRTCLEVAEQVTRFLKTHYAGRGMPREGAFPAGGE
jgi:hypothetical protein